jgi:hypothetical protein
MVPFSYTDSGNGKNTAVVRMPLEHCRWLRSKTSKQPISRSHHKNNVCFRHAFRCGGTTTRKTNPKRHRYLGLTQHEQFILQESKEILYMQSQGSTQWAHCFYKNEFVCNDVHFSIILVINGNYYFRDLTSHTAETSSSTSSEILM